MLLPLILRNPLLYTYVTWSQFKARILRLTFKTSATSFPFFVSFNIHQKLQEFGRKNLHTLTIFFTAFIL
jgi:hypothetical protein